MSDQPQKRKTKYKPKEFLFDRPFLNKTFDNPDEPIEAELAEEGPRAPALSQYLNAAENSQQINERLVLDLAIMQCSDDEIASIMDFDAKDMVFFKKIINRGRMIGHENLRKAQWQRAMEGSVPMQIWLGKEILGQGKEVSGEETKGQVRKLLQLMEAN